MNKILFLSTICARTGADVYAENFGNDGTLSSMIGSNLWWLLPLAVLTVLANVGFFNVSTWQNRLFRKEMIRHNRYMEGVKDRNYDEVIRRNRVAKEMSERRDKEVNSSNASLYELRYTLETLVKKGEITCSERDEVLKKYLSKPANNFKITNPSTVEREGLKHIIRDFLEAELDYKKNANVKMTSVSKDNSFSRDVETIETIDYSKEIDKTHMELQELLEQLESGEE